MEKVPQIRLFGTGQSFRKSSSPAYFKQFTYASPFTKNLQLQTVAPINTHIQRSNSVNKLSQNKPFTTNYYQNALRICQNNRVLNKNYPHTQSYQFLKAPTYLQFNGHKNCCKNQSINNNSLSKPQRDMAKNSSSQFSFKLSQSDKNDFNTNHQLDVYRKQKEYKIKAQQKSNQSLNYFNTEQNTPRQTQKYKTSRKSITDYIDQTPKIKNTVSSSEIEPSKKSRVTPVSFNQITNSYLITNQNQNSKRSVSKGNASSRVLKNQKSLSKFNEITTNVQKMLNQFNSNANNEDQVNKGVHMIEDLEQITRENIELKKQYINKLNEILNQAAEEENYIKSTYENLQVTSSRTNAEKNNQVKNAQSVQKLKNHNVDLVINYSASNNKNNLLNLQNSSKFPGQNSPKCVAGEQLKKRKKLFVTQAQPQSQWFINC